MIDELILFVIWRNRWNVEMDIYHCLVCHNKYILIFDFSCCHLFVNINSGVQEVLCNLPVILYTRSERRRCLPIVIHPLELLKQRLVRWSNNKKPPCIYTPARSSGLEVGPMTSNLCLLIDSSVCRWKECGSDSVPVWGKA